MSTPCDPVQVVEQQLREPSSLTCLWDLRGLSPWEEARLGALLRDLPALLEAQRGAAVGEGGAAAGLREDGQDGGGEEQEADGVDQVCPWAGRQTRRLVLWP